MPTGSHSAHATAGFPARRRAAEFPRVLRTAADAATAAAELRAAGFEVDYVDDTDGVRLGAVRLDGVRLIDNVRI